MPNKLPQIYQTKYPKCAKRNAPNYTNKIITGTQYGYKRPDGVLVIPIGCLKD